MLTDYMIIKKEHIKSNSVLIFYKMKVNLIFLSFLICLVIKH